MIIASISHQRLLMVFHWNLSNSKSRLSRSLLNIQADHKGAVIWMVSIAPSSPIPKTLRAVPSVPIIICISGNLIFHCFLSSLAWTSFIFFAFLDLISVSHNYLLCLYPRPWWWNIVYFQYLCFATSLEFFTSALADHLSQGFEGQQVSSSLQDSSHYSVHSQ